MSETKHSPEPWSAAPDDTAGGIICATGQLCGEAWGDSGTGWSVELEAANLRRIVACVNACAGISTEALESGAPVLVREGEGVVENPHTPARSVLLCLSCGKLPPHSGCEALCPACDGATLATRCAQCVAWERRVGDWGFCPHNGNTTAEWVCSQPRAARSVGAEPEVLP